jgi:hypothetical protein
MQVPLFPDMPSNPFNYGSGLDLSRLHLVHVAPDPRLSRLDRSNQRMMHFMEMLGRVLVLRGIAAADVPTGKAQAQMDPGVAHLHAFFADVLVSAADFDLVKVCTLIRHGVLQGNIVASRLRSFSDIRNFVGMLIQTAARKVSVVSCETI